MAMELLSFFPSADKMKSIKSMLRLLCCFIDRIEEACRLLDLNERNEQVNPEFLDFVKLHEKKLKELNFSNVVNPSVNNAFLFPAIDMSLEPFSWGEVKLSSLQQFCNLHPTVDYERLRRIVQPVLQSQRTDVQLKFM